MTAPEPPDSISDFYALPRAVIGKARGRDSKRLLDGSSRPAPQRRSSGLYLAVLSSYLEDEAAVLTQPDDCAELENSLVEDCGGAWEVLRPAPELLNALHQEHLSAPDLAAFYEQRVGHDDEAGGEMLKAAGHLRSALEANSADHVLLIRSRPAEH